MGFLELFYVKVTAKNQETESVKWVFAVTLT